MTARLFVWQRTEKAPRLAMIAFGAESFNEATSRYIKGINHTRDLRDLKAESNLASLDLESRSLAPAEEVLDPTRPHLLLIGNLLDDQYARPHGDRVMDLTDQFESYGLDVFVLPVVHDVGLTESQAGLFHSLLASTFEGLLAMGGPDLFPRLYHERDTDAIEPNLIRDLSEMRILKSVGRHQDVVTAGICRGSQLCAIAHGYQLVQDIHREIPHAIGHKHSWHEIEIREGTWLHRAVGKKTISVHSFHHEAIDPDSSSTLVVAAEARDGVVEAVQSHDERLLGFQFHPELMATPEGEKIMRAVAGAVAGAHRKRRSRGSGAQGR